jgi:hypothetical protein
VYGKWLIIKKINLEKIKMYFVRKKYKNKCLFHIFKVNLYHFKTKMIHHFNYNYRCILHLLILTKHYSRLGIIIKGLNYSFETQSHQWHELKSEPSRWWPSGKSLRPGGLLPLWSQVRALWLLIWWPLEAYMVVNFRGHGISWYTRKLARTPTLN